MNRVPVKAVLLYITLAVSVLNLIGYVRSAFVMQYQVEGTVSDIREIKSDRDKRNEEMGSFKKDLASELAASEASIHAFIETQKQLNQQFIAHLADKSTHLTESQVQAMVTAQLQPLAVSMGKIEVSVSGQHDQLVRLENNNTQILNLLQDQKVKDAGGSR